MAKKSLFRIDSDYILITLLLIFSGDPITHFMGKYFMLFALAAIFVLMYHKIKEDFYIFALGVAGSLLLLFVAQNFVLGFVSWPGALNYINMFLLGGLIMYLVGDRFAYKLFIIVGYISFISLFFYVFFNLLSLHPHGLEWKPFRTTYLIYSYVEEHHFRNCGPFWEPAAFAGVITLCVAFNINQVPALWKAHKAKVIGIVMALITTQSTTGYIVLFVIGIYYLIIFVKDKTIAITLLPALFVIAVVVYTNATFLQQKLKDQSESSLTLSKGEFSNTRFGSFIFDMHYIKKHPIIGNGFHEITRYADDPELIQLIESGHDLANANGFSNYMACLGIPFMLFYLLLSYNAVSKIERRVALLVIIVILLSLFSEQWLNFPLFTGMIFFNYKKIKYKRNRRVSNQYSNINYLVQS